MRTEGEDIKFKDMVVTVIDLQKQINDGSITLILLCLSSIGSVWENIQQVASYF